MATSLARIALRRAILTGMSSSRGQTRNATSSLRMPAMSPTMTEGGIAGWKKQEGESFVTGDVLLEIETDKATIDVEAQDDGVMGKILKQDGAKGIPVGQVIAILAEEGDDLGSIEVPAEEGSSSSSSASSSSSSSSSSNEPSTKTFSGAPDAAEHRESNASASRSTDSSPSSTGTSSSASGGYGNSGANAEPEHVKGGPSGGEQNVAGGEKHGHGQSGGSGKAMFPSVQRLLTESNLSAEKIKSIKGSGRHGMLTKGDVLFALGKIKSAKGSASKMKPETIGQAAKQATASTNAASAPPAAPAKPLTGSELRRLILQGMEAASKPAKSLSAVGSPVAQSASASVSASHDFDTVLEPYASLFTNARQPQVELPSVNLLVAEKAEAKKSVAQKDEWEGLF